MLPTRPLSSGRHFGPNYDKNGLQKVARPRRREAKFIKFDDFVSARKARIPNATANPTTTVTPPAAQDVSSENATFSKSERFVRDVLVRREANSHQ